MSSDLVVGILIASMVVTSVSYLMLQRRRGISSCGCRGCARCRSGCGINVSIDEEDRDDHDM